MILSITLILINILLMSAVCRYWWVRFDKDINSVGTYVNRHRLLTVSLCCLWLLLMVITIPYAIKQDTDAPVRLIKWNILTWGAFCISYVDIKERTIPNPCILALFVVRSVLLVYEVISNAEFWSDALLYPIIGMLISGGVIGFAMLISRGGIGMGDLKLFLIVGYYVGSRQIFAVMFYTFLISAIMGLVLLATGKAKPKDTMPMAPFVSAGILLEYVFLLVGKV